MGGVMPPEQLALTFEHLDLATKVYPDQKRIESVATLTLTSSRPVPVLILDMYPKFAIAAITVDGRKIAPDRKSVVQGKSVSVRVVLGGRRIIKTKKQQTY